jgi:hypothetical protein
MSKPPEIPSEYIEPHLVHFMGSMLEFLASAYLTEEEKQANGRGTGWTVQEIKTWIKGLEVFVSMSCGIHARLAMSNEMDKMIHIPDADLRALARKISWEDENADLY